MIWLHMQEPLLERALCLLCSLTKSKLQEELQADNNQQEIALQDEKQMLAWQGLQPYAIMPILQYIMNFSKPHKWQQQVLLTFTLTKMQYLAQHTKHRYLKRLKMLPELKNWKKKQKKLWELFTHHALGIKIRSSNML
ncbi:hypothetical protein DACRYDRAFT_109024 [Dacryopinax primogenitus]|uniref:Uncharacterized protein n=1 Tax=Dacryopinax primogenitus (strain DJM 731) TaxID=1858805 RepID=M5G352_DACPD|nr:uncharacterized protein DACRYDRAFT_109024 [Dacryopinax primogenitus]EJU00287.1 hypothetical protein DACRYDRAFT_109024 [Dacryopinax primogenitus]